MHSMKVEIHLQTKTDRDIFWKKVKLINYGHLSEYEY